MIVEEKIKFKSNDPPAITISAARISKTSSDWAYGWKVDADGMNLPGEIIETVCNKSGDINDTLACIENKTFKFSEVFENVSNGVIELNKPELWNTDIFYFWYGAAFTLNSSYRLGTSHSNSLRINLNPNNVYYLWIHDPHFFIQSSNPDTIPQVQINLGSIENLYIIVRPIYHHKMDKPGQPCESSESYSFTACTKNSVSRKIGCRLEWDSWTSQDIPLCTTMDQIKSFEHEYFLINQEFEQSEIVEYTGCQVPCHYTEYLLATDPLRQKSSKFDLYTMLSSTDIVSKKEEIIYDFQSFVAEFGGALGLFLGFSNYHDLGRDKECF